MRRNFRMLIIALSIPIAGQDTLSFKHHYVSIDVISACTGTLLGNYEYRFGRHGICAEAAYTFPLLGTRAYEGNIAYRFHLKPSTKGMFVGPYFKYGKLQASAADETKTKYPYALKYSTLGADWGLRGSLFNSKRLLFTLRLGVGYPFTKKITWEKAPPETFGGISIQTYSSIIRVSAYLDSELTLTFAL